jgi:hypothetical protein
MAAASWQDETLLVLLLTANLNASRSKPSLAQTYIASTPRAETAAAKRRTRGAPPCCLGPLLGFDSAWRRREWAAHPVRRQIGADE